MANASAGDSPRENSSNVKETAFNNTFFTLRNGKTLLRGEFPILSSWPASTRLLGDAQIVLITLMCSPNKHKPRVTHKCSSLKTLEKQILNRNEKAKTVFPKY